MTFYFIISFFLVFCYSTEFSQEDLKQAKVVEFISTKTIDYIDNLKNNLDFVKTEIKKHPFPRSVVSIRSLAKLRGSFANSNYAEAFMLIKYIID